MKAPPVIISKTGGFLFIKLFDFNTRIVTFFIIMGIIITIVFPILDDFIKIVLTLSSRHDNIDL